MRKSQHLIASVFVFVSLALMSMLPGCTPSIGGEAQQLGVELTATQDAETGAISVYRDGVEAAILIALILALYSLLD